MKLNLFRPAATLSVLGLAAAALLLTACSTTLPSEKARLASAGGAQLWAQNCGYCHYLRSPTSYSDAQWEVAMLHMRVRANLTAVEHQKILAFLQSAR